MKICKFCGKYNNNKNIKCCNCFSERLKYIKHDYAQDLKECLICFETFGLNLKKRYYNCGHAFCNKCYSKIQKCGICKIGRHLKVKKYGYFNILPKKMLEKCLEFPQFSHKDILIYLEWCYATQHVDCNVYGIPSNKNFMKIYNYDMSNSKHNGFMAPKKPFLFCSHKRGFITRFYNTYQIYLKLFGNFGLVKDKINMPFFMIGENVNNCQIFINIGSKTITLIYKPGDTIKTLMFKICDILSVEPQRFLFMRGRKPFYFNTDTSNAILTYKDREHTIFMLERFTRN